jgi:hypothetical protein
LEYCGEVGDVGRFVFAAEIDLILGDLAPPRSSANLLDEKVDACGVVLDWEGGFEDVAVAVADEGEVFVFGIVEGDTENHAGITGALEDGADEGVLIAIDGVGLA